MLYSLFIYQSSSGLLLWKKTFEKRMDPNKVELFSSFFSAIQSFVKEIISDTSSKQGLNNLEMGNFLVNVNNISKLDIDVVAIADKSDQSHISKFMPHLFKLLYSHGELFHDWDGSKSRFSVLDLEIMVLVSEQAEQLFSSKSGGELDEQISGLAAEQKEKYLEEIKFLEKKFLSTVSLYKKIEIIDNISSVAEKCSSGEKINWCNRQRKKLESEIENTIFKLNHFISRAKESINKSVQSVRGRSIAELDYRDAYINLYSFSSKLKILGKEDLSNKYRDMAKELIDKNNPKEIPNLIQDILRMPDEANYYLE